jgi:hypothetical protein
MSDPASAVSAQFFVAQIATARGCIAGRWKE